jgi:uncharacterized protein YdeI (YjbR/CyaY-like superfamily)
MRFFKWGRHSFDAVKTLAFKSPADFRKWLAINHDTADGLWLRIFKKASGRKTVTYDEALDEALCFGWIDGLKKSYDELSFIQKFTPRRARSGWSKRNTVHVERLTKASLMMPAGIKAVEAAKADGRWEAAYESPRDATPPEDFLKALSRDKKAKAFFESLNKSNLYAIVYRLKTAKKPETRERRMKNILAMMSRGEKFH